MRETRWQWFGQRNRHGRKIPRMDSLDRRRETPKRSYVDVRRENLQMDYGPEKETENRAKEDG